MAGTDGASRQGEAPTIYPLGHPRNPRTQELAADVSERRVPVAHGTVPKPAVEAPVTVPVPTAPTAVETPAPRTLLGVVSTPPENVTTSPAPTETNETDKTTKDES